MTDLVPLQQNQPTVTFVPLKQTENPFFHLSYDRRKKPEGVDFQYTDEAGNVNKWEVQYNTTKIGYPGIQAHEIWYLLIKPAIDSARKKHGKIPSIIPLGGVRECLRMVGWSAGGGQAKKLLKAISQIGASYCIAELYFPTSEKNEEGRRDYQFFSAEFNRLSKLTVGERKNVLEKDLENMDFRDEDRVAIILHPMEVKYQELEADRQKMIDNQFMFSIKPISRRWYELLVNKVFGTVKNKAEFFEIKYSWYIDRHPPLKRHHQKFRAVEQMNRVVKDLIDSGYLEKAEYRKIKSSDKEFDLAIRYYPGEEAKNSINRIKGFLANKDRRTQIKVKRANYSGSRKLFGQNHTVRPDQEKKPREATPDSETVTESKVEEQAISTITKEHQKLLQILMVKYGVSQSKAFELVTNHYEKVELQIEALPFRNADDETSMLIRSIEENYSIPKQLYEAEEEEKLRIAKAEQDEKDRLWRLKQQKIIDKCSFCDNRGDRWVPADWKMPGKTSTKVKAHHICTHISEKEELIEDWKSDEEGKSFTAGE